MGGFSETFVIVYFRVVSSLRLPWTPSWWVGVTRRPITKHMKFRSQVYEQRFLPRVRIELTTFRLWDWRAVYCANEACKYLLKKYFFILQNFFRNFCYFSNYRISLIFWLSFWSGKLPWRKKIHAKHIVTQYLSPLLAEFLPPWRLMNYLHWVYRKVGKWIQNCCI